MKATAAQKMMDWMLDHQDVWQRALSQSSRYEFERTIATEIEEHVKEIFGEGRQSDISAINGVMVEFWAMAQQQWRKLHG